MDAPITLTGTVTMTGVVTLPDPAPEPEPEPEPPVIVIGRDKPTPGNVGALRPQTKTVTDATVTFNQPGFVRDTRFTGLVRIEDGAHVVFENCLFAYDQDDLPASPAVIIYVEPGSHATLIDSTIQPVSVWWFTGIGNKDYTLVRVLILDCVDSVGAFATSNDPDPAVHIRIFGSYLGALARFAPDFEASRPETHNDDLQAQGNNGPADDILIVGSMLSGYHSTTYGDAPSTPDEHTQIAAIMLSPNTQDSVAITVRRSWLEGGIYTVNGGATQPGTVIVLDDCEFEYPREGGPKKAIVFDPSVDWTVTGCTYPDGTEVPVSNG